MELVPFNQQWAEPSSKLDLKGLYLGKPGDDRIVALPVRRHSDWISKGMSFLTLATAEDVVAVKDELRARGVDLNALAKSYTAMGAFRTDIYLAEQPKREAEEADAIRARLAQIESKGPKPKPVRPSDPTKPADASAGV